MYSRPLQPNVYINNGNLRTTGVSKTNNMQNQDKYYHIFSKYALMETNTPQEPSEPIFLYADYIRTEQFPFEKYKLPELKTVAKHYHLHVSGNKPVLIERIRTFFLQTKSATAIQRIFRGHIVRFCATLRGPGFTVRESCVNETDFYTLEPLKNISHTSFFSYKDDKQYIYGFDIFSIISLISKSVKPINPYNRSEFPYNATVSLHGLYNITKIIFPEIWNDYYATQTPTLTKPTTQRITFPYPNTNTNTITTSSRQSVTNAVAQPTIPHTITIGPAPIQRQRQRTRIEQQREILQILEPIRARPLEVRVRELFMEVNLLGNYAESRWFMDLDRSRLARFYQAYYDWWNTRSRLTPEMQQNICIIDEPFSDVHLLYLYPTTTIEDFREACVRLMENMVYGSRETEYRTLGAMQMLTILTVVSLPARNAMNWLYEAYFT